MFKERKSSSRKNIGFFVCVAFIFTVFPQATQAATKPSSERFPFPEESISLISAIFSFASLNLSTSVHDLVLFCSLSSNAPKPPKRPKTGIRNRNRQEQSSSFKGHGNSTSKKRPKSKGSDD
jgi:hypothetical protein